MQQAKRMDSKVQALEQKATIIEQKIQQLSSQGANSSLVEQLKSLRDTMQQEEKTADSIYSERDTVWKYFCINIS